MAYRRCDQQQEKNHSQNSDKRIFKSSESCRLHQTPLSLLNRRIISKVFLLRRSFKKFVSRNKRDLIKAGSFKFFAKPIWIFQEKHHIISSAENDSSRTCVNTQKPSLFFHTKHFIFHDSPMKKGKAKLSRADTKGTNHIKSNS